MDSYEVRSTVILVVLDAYTLPLRTIKESMLTPMWYC